MPEMHEVVCCMECRSTFMVSEHHEIDIAVECANACCTPGMSGNLDATRLDLYGEIADQMEDAFEHLIAIVEACSYTMTVTNYTHQAFALDDIADRMKIELQRLKKVNGTMMLALAREG